MHFISRSKTKTQKHLTVSVQRRAPKPSLASPKGGEKSPTPPVRQSLSPKAPAATESQNLDPAYFLQMKPAIWHCLTLSNPTTLTLYPGYSSWQFWISARTSSPDWHPNMGSFHMVQYLFS